MDHIANEGVPYAELANNSFPRPDKSRDEIACNNFADPLPEFIAVAALGPNDWDLPDFIRQGRFLVVLQGYYGISSSFSSSLSLFGGIKDAFFSVGTSAHCIPFFTSFYTCEKGWERGCS